MKKWKDSVKEKRKQHETQTPQCHTTRQQHSQINWTFLEEMVVGEQERDEKHNLSHSVLKKREWSVTTLKHSSWPC